MNSKQDRKMNNSSASISYNILGPDDGRKLSQNINYESPNSGNGI